MDALGSTLQKLHSQVIGGWGSQIRFGRGHALVTNKVKDLQPLVMLPMERRPAMLTLLRLSLPLMPLIVAALFAVGAAEAQQPRGNEYNEGSSRKPTRNFGVGGTSWTLSDVWGEPEMPKQSLESPGFNYPPGGYDLNGPPNQAPYPN